VFDNGVSGAGFGGSTSKVCCNFSNPSGVMLVSATDTYSIKGYTIFSSNDSPSRDPSGWILEGSNDGISFTTINTVAGHVFADSFDADSFNRQEGYEASFAPSAAYSYFRFQFLTTQGGGFAIQESELLGDVTLPPAPVPNTVTLMLRGLAGAAILRRRRQQGKRQA